MRRWAAVMLAAACSSPPRAAPEPAGNLGVAESRYLDLRDLRDRIDVAAAEGRNAARNGTAVGDLAREYHEVRRTLVADLGSVDSLSLAVDDRRALRTMRLALGRDLRPLGDSLPVITPLPPAPDCDYEPLAIARTRNGLDSLRRRIYACYGWSQQHVGGGSDTMDRLSVLGALGRTENAAERRRLFLSLEPVWRSVNADNRPGSPYRTLIELTASERSGREPAESRRARLSGVPADSLEPWLFAILEAWREANPDSMIEPWDWYFRIGLAGRALGGRISRERLTELTAQVYRALGADLAALNVRFDLEPREGKTPVAFCTFGARPRRRAGGWTPGEPSVFATYREGGLDNLAELLHETGHAIHIAAIRTRPAFADWPDSDPFTEAVADFAALDVYEPAWQRHWLGDSVPLADGLRSRYGGIVLDVAWSLLELHMLREPGADPNQVWTRLTGDYLRIRPHPELSWWAMRGQLVESPGYMMNYAVGAMLIAAVRARTVELHGPFVTGDSAWYAWVSRRLFRFGLERPAARVVQEFLGGPVTPAALLADLGRGKSRGRASRPPPLDHPDGSRDQ